MAVPERLCSAPGDVDLVGGLRAGDPAAFDAAYARHRAEIYGFLYRLARRRRDLADDLLQETFVALATHARRLRPDTDLRAWLFTVARNAHRTHRRGAIREWLRRVALSGVHDRRAESIPPDARDGVTAIERAFEALDAPHREVLLLSVVHDLDGEALARVLGCSHAAARQRLARARRALAQRLEADADGDGR